MSSLKHWIWLSQLDGIGTVTARHLLDHFITAEALYNAEESAYTDSGLVSPADIKKLMNKDLLPANKVLASCVETGCRILTIHSRRYPDYLKNIYGPPLVLYCKGTLPHIDDEVVVAVVGTRKCTPYGLTAAESIGYRLSSNGIVVATGLARGIDSAATRGALRGDKPVIGVIGTGIDVIYPPENRALYEDVAANGIIISEYPPGTHPSKCNFPMRNRILGGISKGVTVIEAPEKSGALITARLALDHGRDVFSLPGNVDAFTCVGSNQLLQEGASAILSADDILKEYAKSYPGKVTEAVRNEPYIPDDTEMPPLIEMPRSKKVIDNTPEVDYIDNVRKRFVFDMLIGRLDGDEKLVAEAIGEQTRHVDDIIVRSGLHAQQVLTALTMLEINGFVCGENRYYSLAEPA